MRELAPLVSEGVIIPSPGRGLGRGLDFLCLKPLKVGILKDIRCE